MRTPACFLLLAAALTGCGPGPEPEPASPADASVPDIAFMAIEPTEVGIIGAPTLWEALEPLGASMPVEAEGDPGWSVSARLEDGAWVADVVRTGLPDDSIEAEHVRVEFRREPEGWFPTNAYRRFRCRRSLPPGEWSAEPCP